MVAWIDNLSVWTGSSSVIFPPIELDLFPSLGGRQQENYSRELAGLLQLLNLFPNDEYLFTSTEWLGHSAKGTEADHNHCTLYGSE